MKSNCLNAKTTPFCPLDFELWNLVNEIAAPRQVGARNDNGGRAQNDVWGVVARLTLVSRSNLLVGYGIATLAGGFILGAEASGADVDFSFPSFYHNRSSLNIRQPASQGMPFGVAYIMPGLRFFTANLTLHRNFSILLNSHQ